ncbi:MAG: hypothetical protein HYR73_09715 [Candidatus Eisenbacteria bacterium]|nr:hypothetical protein [Candidatus Eisenbacteria bacterium]
MRSWLPVAAVAAVAALVLASPVHAKTFRYSSGPKPPADTLGWVAESELQPLTRAHHPKVPLTNLQLTGLVADTAFARALRSAPLDSGMRVILAPSEGHPMNPLIERVMLRQLARRGITASVRRGLVPDDSLRAIAAAGEPVLEYGVSTARITYLRLVGFLPGRVRIERQALVEGGLTLRSPTSSAVLWVGEASYNLVDRFSRGELALVEDERFSELKGTVPDRNFEKVIEPVIVIAVVAGLIALFFQNRP